MINVKHAKLRSKGILPKRGTKSSAGLDISVPQKITIPPHSSKAIETQIAHECQEKGVVYDNLGLVGMLAPRSGLARKKGIRLFFSPCIIDADYRGDITVMIENTSDNEVVFEREERIAQILYIVVWMGEPEEVPYEQLKKTDRGTGGFGSTGSK